MDEIQPIRVIPTEAYFDMVRRQLADQGQAYVRVTGMSMRPLLRHLRDGVVIVPPGSIRVGDIVLFDRRNGRYALHRVIQKRKTGFTMAGDSQWHMEKNLPYDQIVGVAVCIDRGGRRIPCNHSFMKIYTVTVTALAFPRIHLRKAAGKLKRLLGRVRSSGRKGNPAMKIKPGYRLRHVLDTDVIMGIGSEAYQPNQIMSLNETGAFLWRLLEAGAGKQALVDALLREYDTDAETAGRDVEAFVARLREKGLIEG